MSLQVWLPLNGNLNNQGLSEVTSAGGEVNNEGILGKCYACSSSSYIAIQNPVTDKYDFSFSFWMKVPTTLSSVGAWNVMFLFRALNINDSSTENNVVINWADYNQLKIYDDANHQNIWMSPGNQFNYDKWCHYTITHTGNDSSTTIKVYTDGILRGTFNNSHRLVLRSGDILLGSGINPSYGPIYFNDFRLYDHCLSAKEVKEISKGLLCHYKLDNNGFGNPNLITTMSSGGRTTLNGKYGLNADFSQNADTYGYFNVSPSLELDSTYTLSFDVSNFPVGSAWNFKLWNNDSYFIEDITKDGHYTYTFVPSESKLPSGYSLTKFLFDDGSRTNPSGMVYFTNFKIEKGDKATPWCPHESDELYYQLGICGKNLLPNSTLDRDGWENPNGSAILQDNGYYKVIYSGGGWWGSRYAVNLEAGKTYIASCKGYGTKTQIWFYKDGSNCLGGNINTTNTPQFLYVKYTPTTSGSYYIVCYTRVDDVNYYKDVRFYECNEEIDNSGYLNNGVKVGDVFSVRSEGRYNTSTYCNSTNIGTNTPTGAAFIRCALVNPIVNATALTINWWGNIEDYSYQNSGILSLSNDPSYPGDYENSALAQYDSIFRFNLSDGRDSSVSSLSLIETGNWHMYTLVFNNGIVQGYRDGVSVVSNSKSGTLAQFAYVYLGINQAGLVYRQTKSKWSDFRIYATALSASDIKELYNTSASIDKNGNMYAYEFKEE